MDLEAKIATAREELAKRYPAGVERFSAPASFKGGPHGEGVELFAAEDGSEFSFEGYAAVFDQLSDDLGGFRVVIKRGAFKRVLTDDVRLLVNHDSNLLLARTTSGTLKIKEDPKGLRVLADVAPTQLGKDLKVLMERGDLDQMSFQFQVEEDEWEEADDGTLLRTIISFAGLFDVAPVTFPAFPQTEARISVSRDDLIAEAWSIHRGETEATDARKAAIDRDLQSFNTTSPWAAELAFRAAAEEPELLAAVPDLRVTVEKEPQEPEAEESFATPEVRRALLRNRELELARPT